MTRGEALATVHRLAAGLPASPAGVSRLLERIAGHDQAEELRDALTELGARALLDTATQGKGGPHA